MDLIPLADEELPAARATVARSKAAAKAPATHQEALTPQDQSAPADSEADLQGPERSLTWGYLFSDLLAFAVALTEPLEPTFVLPFPASTAAIRVSAPSISAVRRTLCVALRWLARRFIFFALFVPCIGPSIEHAFYSRASDAV
jgi:hypothetical protein